MGPDAGRVHPRENRGDLQRFRVQVSGLGFEGSGFGVWGVQQAAMCDVGVTEESHGLLEL